MARPSESNVVTDECHCAHQSSSAAKPHEPNRFVGALPSYCIFVMHPRCCRTFVHAYLQVCYLLHHPPFILSISALTQMRGDEGGAITSKVM